MFAISTGVGVAVLAIVFIAVLMQQPAKTSPSEVAADLSTPAGAPPQLAELTKKRARIAAYYEAAVAERDRLAPPPGMDTPEKVRKYYEGRARIDEAKEHVYEAEDMKIRADALARTLRSEQEAGDASPREIKRANDKILRDAETEIYNRKVDRKKKALADTQKQIEETKKANAARQRAASEVERLRGELETIDRQINELPR